MKWNDGEGHTARRPSWGVWPKPKPERCSSWSEAPKISLPHWRRCSGRSAASLDFVGPVGKAAALKLALNQLIAAETFGLCLEPWTHSTGRCIRRHVHGESCVRVRCMPRRSTRSFPVCSSATTTTRTSRPAICSRMSGYLSRRPGLAVWTTRTTRRAGFAFGGGHRTRAWRSRLFGIVRPAGSSGFRFAALP